MGEEEKQEIRETTEADRGLEQTRKPVKPEPYNIPVEQLPEKVKEKLKTGDRVLVESEYEKGAHLNITRQYNGFNAYSIYDNEGYLKYKYREETIDYISEPIRNDTGQCERGLALTPEHKQYVSIDKCGTRGIECERGLDLTPEDKRRISPDRCGTRGIEEPARKRKRSKSIETIKNEKFLIDIIRDEVDFTNERKIKENLRSQLPNWNIEDLTWLSTSPIFEKVIINKRLVDIEKWGLHGGKLQKEYENKKLGKKDLTRRLTKDFELVMHWLANPDNDYANWKQFIGRASVHHVSFSDDLCKIILNGRTDENKSPSFESAIKLYDLLHREAGELLTLHSGYDWAQHYRSTQAISGYSWIGLLWPSAKRLQFAFEQPVTSSGQLEPE